MVDSYLLTVDSLQVEHVRVGLNQRIFTGAAELDAAGHRDPFFTSQLGVVGETVATSIKVVHQLTIPSHVA